MALSLLSSQVAFVPGIAVTVQQSTRVAAASNIVAEEVRGAPSGTNTQSRPQRMQGRGSEHAGTPGASSKAAAMLLSGHIATLSLACAENAVLLRA